MGGSEETDGKLNKEGVRCSNVPGDRFGGCRLSRPVPSSVYSLRALLQHVPIMCKSMVTWFYYVWLISGQLFLHIWKHNVATTYMMRCSIPVWSASRNGRLLAHLPRARHI